MLPIKQLLLDMLANRTRLLLTVLAVAWGAFSIASMLAVGEGLRLTFSGAVKNVGNQALIITGGHSTKSYSGQPSGMQIKLGPKDLNILKKSLAGRAEITATSDWNASFQTKDKFYRYHEVVAALPDFLQMHYLKLRPNSRFFNDYDEKYSRSVIVLGEIPAGRLFPHNSNPLGETVYVNKRPFQVIGLQSKVVNFIPTSQRPDEYDAWIPVSTYRMLSQEKTYTSFYVAVNDLAKINNIQQEIQNYFTRSRGLDPSDSAIIKVINLQTEKQKIQFFFIGIEAMLGFIGFLTLLVAGVGIANVMYISVKRSTRSIGIRMALGATPNIILIYYVVETLLTTALGGALGLLLTELVLMIIDRIPVNPQITQWFGSPHPVLSLNVILMVVGALGLIGLGAGIIPARKAALINPAEALRHE